MDRCPPHFDEGEPFRVDIDAQRVETPIREGDGRTESHITQPDERYPQAVPGQGTITRGGPAAPRFLTPTVPLMRFCGRSCPTRIAARPEPGAKQCRSARGAAGPEHPPGL